MNYSCELYCISTTKMLLEITTNFKFQVLLCFININQTYNFFLHTFNTEQNLFKRIYNLLLSVLRKIKQIKKNNNKSTKRSGRPNDEKRRTI